jgi:hypothetical protein
MIPNGTNNSSIRINQKFERNTDSLSIGSNVPPTGFEGATAPLSVGPDLNVRA